MKAIRIKSLLAVALLLPVVANAVPITGNIGMFGSLLPTCSSTAGTCTMDLADGLDFTSPGQVVFADGDFGTTLAFGDVVTMMDFTFNPFANVNPLWTAGGFSFELTSLNIIGQTSTFLELRGMGVISNASFDDTMGTWALTTNIATGAAEFSWDSTVLAPEPGILLLIGMGLIGGLGARRLTRS